MDGPHDLGGKAGFGAIDCTAPPFRHDWEKRQWALSRNITRPGGSIDWWRHGIECFDPLTYLSLPYFLKWSLNDLAHAVDAGIYTLDEALAGHVAHPAPLPAASLSLEELLECLRRDNRDFSRPIATPPAFALGDRVYTRRHPSFGHTRLPAYARAATGRVMAHHGGHLYPDFWCQGARRSPSPLHGVFCGARIVGDGGQFGRQRLP